MCGITGFVDHKHQSNRSVLQNMTDSMYHRGPDDGGSCLYSFESAQVGLGHRRLAVIDPSDNGHQPMHYKHWTIVYNGEIYNFQEIKDDLIIKGHTFYTNSDTEVILHAFETWGMKCVDKFTGMFAFVIFDHKEEKLFVCRDRMGVKPFYYYFHNGLFLFASELKAMHQHPYFEKEIDANALTAYFDFGYIPGPMSIFIHTFKLEPGHWLVYDLGTRKIYKDRYWSLSTYYSQPKRLLSYEEAKIELKEKLQKAFNYRMVSDVPVGVFLSGGYDSTAVTAILQSERTEKLKTFTIGFEEGNNEAPFAKETAQYLGTDHHELICTSGVAQEIIPKLPHYYDEPFADSSTIPTILVSRFAREQVTVALPADGGDELLSGYNRYNKLQRYQSLMNKVPSTIKPKSAKLAGFLARSIPNKWIHRRHHLEGIASSLQQNEASQQAKLYKWMHLLPRSYLQNLLQLDSMDYQSPMGKEFVLQESREYPMLADALQYLPDDILTKVDRATMSVSLEGRDPLLDHHLIEFVAQLPYQYKRGKKGGKLLLKDIVHDYVPKTMMDRPKAGFSIPFSSWFRGDLNNTLRQYLNEEQIRRSRLLNPNFVNKLLKQFESGHLHYTPIIWKLLVFQMWYEEWMT